MDNNVFVDAYDNARPEDINVECIEKDMLEEQKKQETQKGLINELDNYQLDSIDKNKAKNDGVVIVMNSNRRRWPELMMLTAAAFVVVILATFISKELKKDNDINVGDNNTKTPAAELALGNFKEEFSESNQAADFYKELDMTEDILNINIEAKVEWVEGDYAYLTYMNEENIESSCKLNYKTHKVETEYSKQEISEGTSCIFMYDSKIYRAVLGDYNGERGIRIFEPDDVENVLCFIKASEGSFKYYTGGQNIVFKLSDYENEYPISSRVVRLNLKSMEASEIMSITSEIINQSDAQDLADMNKKFRYKFNSDSDNMPYEGRGGYASSIHIASVDKEGFYYQLPNSKGLKDTYYYSFDKKQHSKIDGLSGSNIDYLMYADAEYAVYKESKGTIHIADYSKSKIYTIETKTEYGVDEYYGAGRFGDNQIAIGQYSVGFIILDFNNMTYHYEDTRSNMSYEWRLTQNTEGNSFLQLMTGNSNSLILGK